MRLSIASSSCCSQGPLFRNPSPPRPHLRSAHFSRISRSLQRLPLANPIQSNRSIDPATTTTCRSLTAAVARQEQPTRAGLQRRRRRVYVSTRRQVRSGRQIDYAVCSGGGVYIYVDADLRRFRTAPSLGPIRPRTRAPARGGGTMGFCSSSRRAASGGGLL